MNTICPCSDCLNGQHEKRTDNLSEKQVEILEAAYRQWPQPFPELLSQLVTETGIKSEELSEWFRKKNETNVTEYFNMQVKNKHGRQTKKEDIYLLASSKSVGRFEYLEEYLDEIQNIQIKFDGTQTTINFAQAGLLLQGTASVYSKKVDYLWTQLLKMLEHLTRKKGLYNDYLVCEDGQVDETGRVKKKARIDMTAEFEELMAEVANNIDIKSDHACVSGRKGELKFIFPTPRQLIDKLGSQGKQIKVNIFLGHKFDLLGVKEDFRVNNQYVTSSGMLGEDLSVDDRDTNSSASFATEDSIDLFDFSSNTSMQRDEKATTEMERTCMESAEMEMTCAGDIPGDDGEYSFAEWIDDASEVVEAGDRSAYSAVVEKSLEMADERSPSTKDVLTEDGLNVTEEVDLFDPWEPLDPHAVNQTPNKALVIGRVSKYPPSILEQRARAKEGNAGGPERLPVIVPIEQFLAAEMTGRKTRFPRIEPEFYDLALKEQKRRKDRKTQQRKRKQCDQQTVEQFSVEKEDHDDADDFCDDVNEDEDIGDVDCEDLDINGDENEDLPDPHLGGDIGIIAMDDDYSPPEEADQPAFSYEALVAKRVAEFLQRSQSLIQTSDLTKRVSAWHDHMAPRLEIIEKRKNFDIHQYGSRLLAFFTGQRRTFSLSEFMRDKPGEEIARFFLSTLMLANTMNVRVGIEPDTDEELGMDNVILTLLTSERHHEHLQNFQSETGKARKVGPRAKVKSRTKAGSQPRAETQTKAGPSVSRGKQRKTGLTDDGGMESSLSKTGPTAESCLSTIEEQSELTDVVYSQFMEDISNTPVIQEGTFLN